MVDQSILGESIRVKLREYDLGAQLLEENLLFEADVSFPEGVWLDRPIINSHTLEVIFALGRRWSIESHATELATLRLDWTGESLGRAEDKPEHFLRRQDYTKLNHSGIDWANAFITQSGATLSDDGTLYAVVFSVHSGLPPDMFGARDTTRLGLFDAASSSFRPLTLNGLAYNDFCPRFLPGRSDRIIFLSTSRSDCPRESTCVYSMTWSNGTKELQKLFATTRFASSCPSFGPITVDERHAHVLLLTEDRGNYKRALGYSVLENGTFSPYERFFNISFSDLPELKLAQSLLDCVTTPWNISGTWLGDVVCDTASLGLVLVDSSGTTIKSLANGSYGEGGEVRANNHPTLTVIRLPNCESVGLAQPFKTTASTLGLVTVACLLSMVAAVSYRFYSSGHLAVDYHALQEVE